ncbi:MAG: hypothetical protein ACOXZ7_06705 [Sphaerochaeta sp.]
MSGGALCASSRIRRTRIDACDRCQWQALCRGGCKRYRSEEGYLFCSSMKEFFPYAIRRFEQVATLVAGGGQ